MTPQEIQAFEQMVIKSFTTREATAQVVCAVNNPSATTHLFFAVTAGSRNRIEKLVRKFTKAPGITAENSGFPTKKYFRFDLSVCEKAWNDFYAKQAAE